MSRTWMLLLVLGFGACNDDKADTDTTDTDTTDTLEDTTDTTDTDDSSMDTDMASMDGIHGDWVSAGADVSGVLQGFNFVSITATFNTDGSYTTAATDDQGVTTDFSGTYTTDTMTDPASITLTQAAPYVATVQGVYDIDMGVMSYDVAQIDPDIGVTPANPTGGMGSSTAGTANVQTFRRP